MTTIVASANLKYTLGPALFEHGLRMVLAEHPDLVSLQETGTGRDHTIQRVAAELGYSWARAHGGEPVMWRTARYGTAPRSVRPVRLARAEYVGHLIGRKDRLPPSIATEVCLDDSGARRPDSAVTVLLDYHLTAEIQDMRHGGGYKKDPAHLLRVLRHRREKHRLGRRARMQQRRGRNVYAAGDSNYAGMVLGRFASCWDRRRGGTLGGRPVDIVFTARKSLKLWTLPTPSDHDALFVIYR